MAALKAIVAGLQFQLLPTLNLEMGQVPVVADFQDKYVSAWGRKGGRTAKREAKRCMGEQETIARKGEKLRNR